MANKFEQVRGRMGGPLITCDSPMTFWVVATQRQRDTPSSEQTDTTENITFPQYVMNAFVLKRKTDYT